MAEDASASPRRVPTSRAMRPPRTAFEAARGAGPPASRLAADRILRGSARRPSPIAPRRRLLGAPADDRHGVLGADRRSIRSAARSSPAPIPTCWCWSGSARTARSRKTIPVDEARKLSEFFSKSPASAPHRVAIIDAADDLNINAANAVLKTLEEPPPSGVLLLVSHSPGRLLATIRSRCRRLAFAPSGLKTQVTAFVTERRTDSNAEDAIRLARMSGGAPGQGLEPGPRPAPSPSTTRRRSCCATCPRSTRPWRCPWPTNSAATDGAVLSSACCSSGCQSASTPSPWLGRQEGRGGLDRWAQAWETLQRLPREVDAVNLDRTDALFTALSELRDAARA